MRQTLPDNLSHGVVCSILCTRGLALAACGGMINGPDGAMADTRDAGVDMTADHGGDAPTGLDATDAVDAAIPDGGSDAIDSATAEIAMDAPIDAVTTETSSDAATSDGPTSDATSVDGSATDASVSDGSVTDASVTDGSATDASGADGSIQDAFDSSPPDASGDVPADRPDVADDVTATCPGDGGCALANAASVCRSGTCAIVACNAMFADCDGVAANGCEVATDTSRFHCGGCGMACVAADTCVTGTCRRTAGTSTMSLGVGHTCVRRLNGLVTCWGAGESGQLGEGSMLDRNAPGSMLSLSDISNVAAGGTHTCAIRNPSHAVECWGGNDFGQLGDATRTMALRPRPTMPTLDAAVISAGTNHSCAVLYGGPVRCWGANAFGQLGDGTTIDRSAPVAVIGAGAALGVDAGAYHTCVRRLDNTMACWGRGTQGQLGNGSMLSSTIAVGVSGVTDASASFCVGGSHSCVRRASGAVACWGDNSVGQLGDGTTVSRSVPTPVTGLVDAQVVTCGEDFTCALRATGAVVCWGANLRGQLGDGTRTMHSVPAPVSGLTGVTNLGAGAGHACSVQTFSNMRCWGGNARGQLGDGTTTDRLLPVAVLNLP